MSNFPKTEREVALKAYTFACPVLEKDGSPKELAFCRVFNSMFNCCPILAECSSLTLIMVVFRSILYATSFIFFFCRGFVKDFLCSQKLHHKFHFIDTALPGTCTLTFYDATSLDMHTFLTFSQLFDFESFQTWTSCWGPTGSWEPPPCWVSFHHVCNQVLIFLHLRCQLFLPSRCVCCTTKQRPEVVAFEHKWKQYWRFRNPRKRFAKWTWMWSARYTRYCPTALGSIEINWM